ncbi:NIPSNAP family protein [Candidatus Bathyarchaeota archaeon]|nr:NIPSNAP family protein [Candidatus Bathyarchaeota archaeon]
MIYEWRVYEAWPGRMDALNERFAKTTLGFFEKHGIKVIGFWTAVVGTSNVLYYMLAYDSLAHREKAWTAFGTDPEWIKARKATEEKAGGPLTTRITNTILAPISYSPMK